MTPPLRSLNQQHQPGGRIGLGTRKPEGGHRPGGPPPAAGRRLRAARAYAGAAWRTGRRTGRADRAEIRDGDEWKKHDWNSWRRRVYRPGGTRRGASLATCVRAAHAAAWSRRCSGRAGGLAYVAGQVGCSIATLARHYAGVIAELEGQPRIPAADAIRVAREQVATVGGVTWAQLTMGNGDRAPT